MLPPRDPDQARPPVVGFSHDYEPGMVPAHAHARRAQVMYAVQGAMTAVTDHGRWVLPPERALWVPPGIAHTVTNARPIKLRTLYVAPDAEGKPVWPTCAVVGITPLVRELILACVDFPWDYGPAGPEARLARVLLDRLTLLPEEPLHMPEPRDSRARAAAEVLKRQPGDNRTVREIAREAGASGRTMERLFVEETGLSFGAWRLRLRMLEALERLAAGDSVTSTAFAVGYENPSSFIAAFRTIFGTTPARYFTRRED